MTTVADVSPDLAGRWYLAGPMTGIPQFNFPAFNRAAAEMRSRLGMTVVSPAELDDPATLAAAMASPDGAPGAGSANGETWGDFLARDVKLVADGVDGVVVLPGWADSRGAQVEVLVARLCGKPVLSYPDMTPLDAPVGGEVRVTSATGGEKGSKPERFDLIPYEGLTPLARVYGFGATKYDDDNWRRGYDWSLSFAALQRHLAAFWTGADDDDESGLPHLAHAAWHCLTLLTFASSPGYAGYDTRGRRPSGATLDAAARDAVFEQEKADMLGKRPEIAVERLR